MIDIGFDIFFISFVVVLQSVYLLITSCKVFGMYFTHVVKFMN